MGLAKHELHPFERAGFGVAPFKYDGMTKNVYISHPGAPHQPGGSCDYCCNGIMFEFWVKSADGKRFKVGSDCINRIYRSDNEKRCPIKAAIDRDRRKHETELRHEREQRQIKSLFESIDVDAMAAAPHQVESRAERGETAADQLAWYMKNAGTAGKLKILKMMAKRFPKQSLTSSKKS